MKLLILQLIESGPVLALERADERFYASFEREIQAHLTKGPVTIRFDNGRLDTIEFVTWRRQGCSAWVFFQQMEPKTTVEAHLMSFLAENAEIPSGNSLGSAARVVG